MLGASPNEWVDKYLWLVLNGCGSILVGTQGNHCEWSYLYHLEAMKLISKPPSYLVFCDNVGHALMSQLELVPDWHAECLAGPHGHRPTVHCTHIKRDVYNTYKVLVAMKSIKHD